MVEGTSYMFVTGPDVIKTVTHEEVTKEDLGGAMTHNATSGVAHFAVPDDAECLRLIRDLLGFLPSNNLDDPPRRATDDPIDREDAALDTLVPEQPNQPYDMHDLIRAVVDDGVFLEVHRHFAHEHRRRVRAAGRASGRHRGQSAGGAGRMPRHRRVGQGRAIRPVLRRLQHSARSPSRTCRGSCPACGRNTAASSAPAPSSCTRLPRPPCRRSR